jgi:hypothetical protein
MVRSFFFEPFRLLAWLDVRLAPVLRPVSRIALLILIPVVGLWYIEGRQSTATLPVGSVLPRIPTEPLVGPSLEPGRTSRPMAMVVFTASCPFCRDQLLRWDTLWTEVKDRVDMLAISFSDRKVTEAILAERPHPYSVAYCGDARSWSEWRITRVPTVFLLDPRGILVAQWTGLKNFEDERGMLYQLASLNAARR